mmetsp:Transcript_16187/g.50651  ORF Transcript_16187/g.50651 Transcript_16187/m.50651 type:complete len:244 (-) Transcript_16187:391-1122(-)
MLATRTRQVAALTGGKRRVQLRVEASAPRAKWLVAAAVPVAATPVDKTLGVSGVKVHVAVGLNLIAAVLRRPRIELAVANGWSVHTATIVPLAVTIIAKAASVFTVVCVLQLVTEYKRRQVFCNTVVAAVRHAAPKFGSARPVVRRVRCTTILVKVRRSVVAALGPHYVTTPSLHLKREGCASRRRARLHQEDKVASVLERVVEDSFRTFGTKLTLIVYIIVGVNRVEELPALGKYVRSAAKR